MCSEIREKAAGKAAEKAVEKTAEKAGAGSEACAFVYLLRCSDGSFYCGYTTDPERRLRVHNSGKGAKYTRSRRPVELCYLERCETRNEALRREAELKKLRHAERAALSAGWRPAET